MQYNIEILQLVVDNTNTNYPKTVIRAITAVSVEDTDTHRGAGIGWVFDLSAQAPADVFTPFEQLTKEQIMSWILVPGMAEQVSAAHTAVDQIFNPPVQEQQAVTPPWVPLPTVNTPAMAGGGSANTPYSSTSTLTTSTSTSLYMASEEHIIALIYKVLDDIEASKV